MAKARYQAVVPEALRPVVHAEIAETYAQATRSKAECGCWSMTRQRIGELERLFERRYGPTLTDDDSGRDDVELMAHHLAHLYADKGEAVSRIVEWAARWAPWLPPHEAGALAKRVAEKPSKFTATSLGWRQGLTAVERKACRITTIRAAGQTLAEIAANRKGMQAAASREYRARKARAAGRPVGVNGRPRKNPSTAKNDAL